MPTPDNPVVPKRGPISEQQFHTALVAGLGRVAQKTGRGALADKSGRTTRALDKLFSGASTDTSGRGLLDFLNADATALDEVAALYGFCLTPRRADPANDMDLVTNLSRTVAEYLGRIADGKRCHIDTAVLANLFRPLIPQMQAIVDESDRTKGVAA